MSARRFELAAELADDAELLVRAAEAAVDAARDPTMRDVAETELQLAMQLQDEVLEDVAPAIEGRERQIRADVRAAVASLRDEPGSDWMSKHRRWMSAAVKSRLVRRLGRRTYEKVFPFRPAAPIHGRAASPSRDAQSPGAMGVSAAAGDHESEHRLNSYSPDDGGI